MKNIKTDIAALGFDPSLTSSGYAHYNKNGDLCTGVMKCPKLRDLERLAYFSDKLNYLLQTMGPYTDKTGRPRLPDILAYEDYAMGYGGKSNPGRSFSIGELGGVLKLVAFRLGVDLLLVPPSNLKMFATGSGNASKEEVVRAVMDYWGQDIKQNDQADAFVLLQMGIAYKDRRVLRTYNEQRRRALGGCTLYRFV